MNKTVKLSIIIPTYNRESTILRAINSALSSNRDDIEIIISDDGSTDNTVHLVKSLKHPQVSIIESEKNNNANHARLQGVISANSSTIAFLDSDDEFHPHRASSIIDHFNSQADSEVLIDSFIVQKKNNYETTKYPSKSVDNTQLEELLVAHAIPLTFSSISAKKSRIVDNNLIDTTLHRHQDRDFILNAICKELSIKTRTINNVTKNQENDSFSRSYIGYISGLDAITCKHSIFRKRKYKNITSYLIARTFLKTLLKLDINAFLYNLSEYNKSKCLPKNLFLHLLRYFHGKSQRRKFEKESYI